MIRNILFNKVIFFLILLFTFSCKTRSSSFLPKLDKEDSKIVRDFFFFVHKEKEFSLVNLEKISKVQNTKYFTQSIKGFKKIRYLPNSKKILYINLKDSNLWVYDLKTNTRNLLKKFSKPIYSFDVNNKENQILLRSHLSVKVYSFPNFNLLDDLGKCYTSYFSENYDNIYYSPIRGKLYLRLNKKNKLIHSMKDVAYMKFYFTNNQDIFIYQNVYNTGDPDSWAIIKIIKFLIYGKYSENSFLLSSPNQKLKHNNKPLSIDINYNKLYHLDDLY